MLAAQLRTEGKESRLNNLFYKNYSPIKIEDISDIGIGSQDVHMNLSSEPAQDFTKQLERLSFLENENLLLGQKEKELEKNLSTSRSQVILLEKDLSTSRSQVDGLVKLTAYNYGQSAQHLKLINTAKQASTLASAASVHLYQHTHTMLNDPTHDNIVVVQNSLRKYQDEVHHSNFERIESGMQSIEKDVKDRTQVVDIISKNGSLQSLKTYLEYQDKLSLTQIVQEIAGEHINDNSELDSGCDHEFTKTCAPS